ncbi:phenylacetate--CoA ligase family protein [Sediminibacter sp. Hel_I_10]|uniref:phenylacetate--CoA ligase family protein n=1 Tax=Sediminibacter sp. Hel_I_10 TaxID=1392490 RepID=UPI00047B792C|nr:phenylacetate--CoA ligase family protein [Sediminibacter sp. Hel_I_10]
MKLFDLTLKLNGFPLEKAKRELTAIQEIKEQAFDSFLSKKRKDILDFHIKNNPFYKAIVHSRDISDWEHLPVMTKRDLQSSLEERLSHGFSSKHVYINKTSGSSGDPFIFAKDKFCHAMTWAVIQNRFGWYGLDFNSSKQARFYGIPLDKKGYYKERLKDAFGNRYRFSVFDLSDAAFETCLQKFERSPFDYINGYTSSIVQFAKFLKTRDLKLKSICPSLKVCIVTSEMLFEDDRQLMEEAFGVPIVNEYGASELDLIAFQNPKGDWQVNSETLYVEILNAQGEVVPNGTEGRIVITSLYNKAHPFIRYDIGDIGQLSKASTLQKPILEKLVGRTNDIAILPSGKKAAGLTFYYITKSIIENDGNVKEFVIEQQKRHLFKITYVSETLLSEEKKNTILKAIVTYLEDGLTVNFERKERLSRSDSGKLKQFSSLVNIEDS